MKTMLLSSLSQVIAVLIFCLFYYSIHWALILRKNNNEVSFFHYIGFQSFKNQFDKKYFFIMFLLALTAIITTTLEFHFLSEFK